MHEKKLDYAVCEMIDNDKGSFAKVHSRHETEEEAWSVVDRLSSVVVIGGENPVYKVFQSQGKKH